MSDNTHYPLRLLICSWATGIGGGAARMEYYYQKYFDPTKISCRIIGLTNQSVDMQTYGSTYIREELPSHIKFHSLVNLFSSADIVQFQGSFDPLVCEAAKCARVPLLIEVIHNIEKGGLFENIDLSICVSNAVKERQNNSSQSTEVPSIMIHNGIELSSFPFSTHQRSKDKIILLQVGNRSKIKVHLDEIAPALLERMPNLEFWIAGREQERESSEQIKFLRVQEDIASLYRKADFMVLFSENESFGLVALEAMASGCIPIVSATGGFPELIEDNQNCFLLQNPDKERAISLLLEILSDYPNERFTNMRNAGRQHVEDNFSIQSCVGAYESVYIDLFNEKNATKKIRRNRIIVDPPLTPGNALVGDALYSFHSKDYASCFYFLEQIIRTQAQIDNPTCIETACDFALFSLANNKKDLGNMLFTALINQTEEPLGIIEKWLSFDSSSQSILDGAPSIRDIIVQKTYHKRSAIIACAERLITENIPQEALLTFEMAKELSIGDPELQTEYEKWIERLRVVLPVQ